jgi:putative SOS response-associated peptidase YedK
MCFYVQQNESIAKVKARFKAEVRNQELFTQSEIINGFSHPHLPVILDTSPKEIQNDYTWGLLPHWADDISFRKNTLNARIETVGRKPSFMDITEQRCLIIATAFYEWHWNDDKGKTKQKYTIYSEEEIFTFAGLYSTWNNPVTEEELKTFTMLTTQANKVMEYIHNHKKRMPIILKREDEQSWLDHSLPLKDLAYPYQTKLIAF